MAKTGGILGLIAGIFGVLGAIVTLVVGGGGSMFQAEGAGEIVALGWAGLICSGIVIVLGAVGLGSSSRWPGILMIISSLAGAIYGGTVVAIAMVLSLIGGLLSALGSRRKAT